MAVVDRHRPLAVVHFAAFIEAGESVHEPGRFYCNNVGGTLSLLNALRASRRREIGLFIFRCGLWRASMHTYSRTHPLNPTTPYGRSKLMTEQILADISVAQGLSYCALRYFNAAGADPEGELSEHHDPETHLIPVGASSCLWDQRSSQDFRNGLRHAGRNLCSRLCACRRFGGRACLGCSTTACLWPKSRGQPRNRARIFDPGRAWRRPERYRPDGTCRCIFSAYWRSPPSWSPTEVRPGPNWAGCRNSRHLKSKLSTRRLQYRGIWVVMAGSIHRPKSPLGDGTLRRPELSVWCSFRIG